MRYDKGQKDASRQRIMKVATARFQTDGIEGAGLARIMGDAGLTNGAFYAHFASKTALVRETFLAAIAAQAQIMRELLESGGVEGLVDGYLSVAHRDDPALGCPLAALLPDLARQPAETRQACEASLRELTDILASALPPQLSDRHGVATALFALLAGTLQMARATADTPQSEITLFAGRRTARALVSCSH